MPTSDRWPALDGIRAIAVLAVVAYHLGLPFSIHGGAIGVTVFFGLSGFLITTLLLREGDDLGSIRLRSFFMRRALRLLPALVVLCAAVYRGRRSAVSTTARPPPSRGCSCTAGTRTRRRAPEAVIGAADPRTRTGTGRHGEVEPPWLPMCRGGPAPRAAEAYPGGQRSTRHSPAPTLGGHGNPTCCSMSVVAGAESSVGTDDVLLHRQGIPCGRGFVSGILRMSPAKGSAHVPRPRRGRHGRWSKWGGL